MEVGSDDTVIALSFNENSTGKTFADTKVRYSWEVSIDGKVHKIEFTNTKTSGKKRIFVDGRLMHELTVFRSSNFQYSWPIGSHLLSIVPVQAQGSTSLMDQMMDKMANTVDCQFELRINGLPFRAFRKRPTRPVPVRPTASRPTPRSEQGPDHMQYLEMQRKVQEIQRSRSNELSVSQAQGSPWQAQVPKTQSDPRSAALQAAEQRAKEFDRKNATMDDYRRAQRTAAPSDTLRPRTERPLGAGETIPGDAQTSGDPWRGSGYGTSPATAGRPPASAPLLTSKGRFDGQGEESPLGEQKYGSFLNSDGGSSEDDGEAFTTYGGASRAPTAQAAWPGTDWPQASPSAWPASPPASGSNAWPSVPAATAANDPWGASAVPSAPSAPSAQAPPQRTARRQPVPTHALPWEPVPVPAAGSLPAPGSIAAAKSPSRSVPAGEDLLEFSPARSSPQAPQAAGQKTPKVSAESEEDILEQQAILESLREVSPKQGGSEPAARQDFQPAVLRSVSTLSTASAKSVKRQALLQSIGLGARRSGSFQVSGSPLAANSDASLLAESQRCSSQSLSAEPQRQGSVGPPATVKSPVAAEATAAGWPGVSQGSGGQPAIAEPPVAAEAPAAGWPGMPQGAVAPASAAQSPVAAEATAAGWPGMSQGSAGPPATVKSPVAAEATAAGWPGMPQGSGGPPATVKSPVAAEATAAGWPGMPQGSAGPPATVKSPVAAEATAAGWPGMPQGSAGPPATAKSPVAAEATADGWPGMPQGSVGPPATVKSPVAAEATAAGWPGMPQASAGPPATAKSPVAAEATAAGWPGMPQGGQAASAQSPVADEATAARWPGVSQETSGPLATAQSPVASEPPAAGWPGMPQGTGGQLPTASVPAAAWPGSQGTGSTAASAQLPVTAAAPAAPAAAWPGTPQGTGSQPAKADVPPAEWPDSQGFGSASEVPPWPASMPSQGFGNSSAQWPEAAPKETFAAESDKPDWWPADPWKPSA